jgi:preprotein translocase subunit SecE
VPAASQAGQTSEPVTAMSGKTAGVSVILPELFRFGVYKPNQGRMVRQFTFFGVITVAAFGCMTLSNGPMMGYDPPVKVGVPIAIWAVISWIAFRVVNVPRIADFLVSVEAELEKVTWPLWKEVTQATVVVISTMFIVGLFLFLVDIVWQKLFSIIRFVEY